MHCCCKAALLAESDDLLLTMSHLWPSRVGVLGVLGVSNESFICTIVAASLPER